MHHPVAVSFFTISINILTLKHRFCSKSIVFVSSSPPTMVSYYMQDYPDEYTFHPRSYHIVPPALRRPSSRRSTVHRRRRRRHSASDVPQQYLDHRMSPSGTALSDPYYQSGHYMDNEDSEVTSNPRLLTASV